MTSFKEHIKAINQEMRKKQPDYAQIKIKMRRTLFQRIEQMKGPTEKVISWSSTACKYNLLKPGNINLRMVVFNVLFTVMILCVLKMHYEMMMQFGTDMENNMQNALNVMAPTSSELQSRGKKY